MKTVLLALLVFGLLFGALSYALPKGDALCQDGNCPTPTGVKHTKTPTDRPQDTATNPPPATETKVNPTDTDVPPATNTKVVPTDTNVPPTDTQQPPTEIVPTDTTDPTVPPEITDTPGVTMPPPPTDSTTATVTSTRDPRTSPTNTLPPTFPPPSNPKVTPDKNRVLPITGGDNSGSGLGLTAILAVFGFAFVVFGLRFVRK